MPRKVRFNPRSKKFQNNPYDIYKQLRIDDPIIKVGGNWLITKYKHVRTLLMDKDIKSINLLDSYKKIIRDREILLPEKVLIMLNNILLLQEGQFHRVHKKGLIPLVTGPFMKELEEIIEEEVMDVLTNILGRRNIEVMSEIATKLWQRIFSRWLNLSNEQKKIFVEAQKKIRPLLESPGILSIKDFNDGIESLHRISLMCDAMLQEGKQLKNSLFYRAILSGYDEDHNEVEKNIFADVINILVAISETNESLTGSLFLELANDRCSQHRLRREPQRFKQAINEIMRLHSPVQLTRRVATHSFWLDDKEIAMGDILLLCLGSANRDEDVFLYADQFDMDRNNVTKHIGFSTGLHNCLGQQLAIRQTEILCNVFFDRFPVFTLNSPEVWQTENLVLRSLKVLNINFECTLKN
ncbi:cytochrome P450 [Serratia sp. NPDC078593]|uniref:cytochrome P450 n=1 Tax=unclassified Serratia (in: enterobacteria) TaxID=2647522 RepID=UPI0037CCEF89